METRQIAGEYRLAHWAQIMRERKESGQTIKEYCKNTGISLHAYYYWNRKLRREACEKLTEIQRANNQTALDMPRFAEIKLGHPNTQLAGVGTTHPSDINLEIGNIRLTFSSSYPPQLLAALLKEMVGQC